MHTWIKIWEGYLRSEESQTHTRPPSPGSSVRKISPRNFWLWKPAGIESVEEAAGALSSSSWRTHTPTHPLRLAPTELQHWDSSLKGTSGTEGATKVSGIRVSRGHCLFAEPPSPPPARAARLVPYLRLHEPGQHCVTHLGDPQRLHPTQLLGSPKLLFHKNGWSWLLNPIK